MMIKLKCGDVITPNDLRPGDKIKSYKKPSKWNILQKFFDLCLVFKGKQKYGKNCVFPKCNHDRTYMGKDEFGVHKIFEWTYPLAREVPLEDWMLDPTYSRIYRYNGEISPLILRIIDTVFFDTINTHHKCMILSGKSDWRKYDWAQLIDMLIGWERVLDCKPYRRVCSTGSRWLVETAFDVTTMLDTPIYKTLPCADANESDYSCINYIPDVTTPPCPEPKLERK